MNFSVFEAFCAYLYKKRLLLAVNFWGACVAGAVYVFTVLEKEYSASVTFLPPASDNSMPSSMSSLMNLSMPSLSAGGASPEQVEIVFQSNATKRRIIDEFNLVKYFKLEKSQNTFVLAAKRLKKYAILTSSDKGGLGMSKAVSYDITCYYSSPDTAKMMAEFTFGIVDSAIREISIDKAQRNRMFVEKQIVVQNEKMDSLQLVFQEYQNTHRAYDVPEQAKFSLKAYADLKSLALMNEMRLSSIRSEFSGATQEIAELRRHQRVFEAKLKEYE
ncbi:MAG: hypothetical protein LBH93_08735, partial [Chitinispirillales bacterium]|nr:hypothetical protein [Chitinispirillales bacterium]